MIERVWRYVHSFRYNTGVWRADGQTDGRVCPNNNALTISSYLIAFKQRKHHKCKNVLYFSHFVSAFMMLLCGSHTKLDHYVSFVLVTIHVLKCFFFSIADMTVLRECSLNWLFRVFILYFLTVRGALKRVLVQAARL